MRILKQIKGEIKMRESIKLDNDKYEVVLVDNGRDFKALRYGEEWRNLIGDNLVLSMFFEIQDLKEEIKELRDELEHVEVYNMIKEREENESGKRCSLEDIGRDYCEL